LDKPKPPKSLGVYVSCRNEEHLIVDCVSHIMRVFPQVEVMDVGSEDESINKVRELGVYVHEMGILGHKAYITEKNRLSDRHDFVLWVDGDEIWPTPSLLKIKQEIYAGEYRVFGCWKMMKSEGGELFVSELYASGEMAWNTREFTLKREWPNECLKSRQGNTKRLNKRDCRTTPAIWCWHGSMLRRTSVEETALKKSKRLERMEMFTPLRWERIGKLPWGSSDPGLMEKLKW
jgi:hypothetical protein